MGRVGLAERRDEESTNLVDIERAKKILDYDQDTGVFRWKAKVNRRIIPGSVAGTEHCMGYICLSVDKKRVLAHRLAWMFVYGEEPKNCLDHINRNKKDNRISNLREVSRAENNQNQSISTRNKSGAPGVGWDKRVGKWRAWININKRQIWLGYFELKEEAITARKEAKKKYHPFGNEG